MTLKELVEKNNWEGIESILIKSYPDLKRKTSYFHNVYIELTKMNPIHCNLILYIRKINSKNEDDDITVSGIGEPHELGNTYNISGINWKKWLRMEIHPETIKNFNESEIIVHSLYEMTFLGFSENEIKTKLNTLTD
ncbi:DUF6557 family protein [uncultured Dokdonia sp.]|uniref:DUF6557 family protein n=1 Tax=uncultured Dokdonia sp. TaxID=575653 RepID=UPI002615441C|nr:DUF6557 family protein [uncultured Dokdonia sp.]